MKSVELQQVKASLLNELDVTLQRCCHQGLGDVMNDLRIHYATVKPDSSPDEIFSLFLQSGILKSMTGEPVVRVRESLERLRLGTFGMCRVCGKEISSRVLVQNPLVTRCAACENESEKLTRTPRW